MEVKFKESPKEVVNDNFEESPLDAQLRIKTSIKDLPIDLEMKLLPAHLEYAYLEKASFLLIIIASYLKTDEKERIVFILKNHKEAFAWKTSDISDRDYQISMQYHLPMRIIIGEVLVYCIPKKGGMTVVTNERNELVPTRTVIGWWRETNSFVFSTDFLDVLKIPIEPADQEKTTFTCPFGTYAYRHMSFGICNAHATFQRCMIEIFQDMLEPP
ncbi:hypothetical protein Tco_0424424 [Tanacetum coccineum]